MLGRVGGFAVLLILALGATTMGCASEPPPPPVYASLPPPDAPVELEGSAPSPAYLWVRGHYFWNGVEYVWIPGHWQTRPHTHAVWVTGRWQHTRHGWLWVEGHWT